MSLTARLSSVATACIVATSAALLPTTASADTVAFPDASGDLSSGLDIQSVKVANDRPLTVAVAHRHLRRGGTNGTEIIYLDTRLRNPGPEYAVTGNIQAHHQGWRLVRTERWAGGFRDVRCDIRGIVSFKADVSKVVIPRPCLSSPGGVRVSEAAADRSGRVDWAPRFHRFYSKVIR
jgi:hypothetical protein